MVASRIRVAEQKCLRRAQEKREIFRHFATNSALRKLAANYFWSSIRGQRRPLAARWE